ncbi:MAG: hypothetical protein J2P43_01275 [Candidatus Dormibacteraeota bacterium]|nr:hypothetical protein [Candidatus Dormibacteraeota bacterium]
MVTFATPGRPPIAYLAVLCGNISAGFLMWSLGDDAAAIIGLALAAFFALVVLSFLGVVFFRNLSPRLADEGIFLNGAFFAGVAAIGGYQLWIDHGPGDPKVALGAIFAYAALVLGASSIWLGLRADRRHQLRRKGGPP